MPNVKAEVEVTGASVIKKLREIVQPPGKKGLWLRHLSDQKLAEVYHRVRMGQSAHHITKIAQKDWGVMKNSTPKSLARAMVTFRDKVLGEIKVDAIKSPEGKKEYGARKKRAKRITDKLDGMGRLRWLIEVQTDRLEQLIERESKSLPFKTTDKTVEILGGLIDKYIQYMMDLGLVDSKPPELNVNISHKFSQLIGVLPDDGARLISAANRFLDMATKEAILMEPDSTGVFAPEANANEEEEEELDE